ncbi:hypothetical protein CCP3SC1_260035 [Gammaproteobacteria bacterium]
MLFSWSPLTNAQVSISVGMAYTSQKLKIHVGDFKSMLKDPRMAAPFIKSLSVMARV